MAIKINKLQSTLPQKIGKILVWTLLGFFTLMGIGSFFRPSSTLAAKEVIKSFTDSQEYIDRVTFEAAAFSESFALEFMTYQGINSDDYVNRMKKYVPAYLEFRIPFGNDTRAEALSTEAQKITWTSGSQLNVDVKVKVRYVQKKRGDALDPNAAAIEKVAIEDSYIRIPIAEKDGRYLVEDYPAFIPEPDKAAVKFENYSGKSAESSTSKEISEVLENFFRTYYNGNAREIAYYMLDSSKQVKGLEKRYEFVKLDTVNAYLKEEKNKYLVTVSLMVKDSINEQQIPQRFHVDIAKKEERFYIESFDVRTGNLNIQNNK